MNYKEQLSLLLAQASGLDADKLASLLEVPPDMDMGDFALPCFKLARELRKAPPAIAQQLLDSLGELPPWIDRAELAGGYLNFFLSRTQFVGATLGEVAAKQERYGSSDEGAGRNIVLDYSSINIAKPFHIGHLSTTVIGSSLYKIFNFLGFHSVGVNHLGDWGTQFGKLISAYKRWGDRDTVEQGSIRALLALYVRFHEEAEKNPSLEDEGRAWFKKIEDGDEEALSLFSWFKELTLREVSKIYDILDVHFDSYAGESFYNDKMQPVIDELRGQGPVGGQQRREGGQPGRLQHAALPHFEIGRRRRYMPRATWPPRFTAKRPMTSTSDLYVVAYQQNLHFRQLFKVIELMGYRLGQGHGAMSRSAWCRMTGRHACPPARGASSFWRMFIHQPPSTRRCAIIEEKNPSLPDKDKTAQDSRRGRALSISTLSNSRIKDIVFDLDRMLNFDGETGPYVQYTHARAHVLCCARQRTWPRVGAGLCRAGTCPQALCRSSS